MRKLEFVQDPDKTGDDAVTVSDKKRKKLDIIPLIVCLLVAVVVWLWMVNLNDTEATEIKLLKIEYIGMQDAEHGNVMFYGNDKTEISVTVQGSNRDLKKYEDSEYHAIVDLSGYTVNNIEAGEKITLPITVTAPENSSLKILDSIDLNVSMLVDIYTIKHVPFDAMVAKLSDDTNTYEKIVNNGTDTKIAIAGPSKLVELISYARYNINSELLKKQDGKTFEDFKEFVGTETNTFPLTFLNEHYDPVKDTDGIIKYSTEDIEVDVNVIAHKEVPVKVQVRSGSQGNSLTATSTPGTIKIAGKPSSLADISEYLVTLNSAVENTVYTQSIVLPDEWAEDGIKIENPETQIQITFSSNVEDNK